MKRRRRQRALTKARKRAAKLPTGELFTWIDTTLVEIGRSLRSEQTREYSRMYAEALLDMIEELESRTEAPSR